jgi:hypothetical protein
MKLRRILLRTTMLSGLVGGVLLTALETRAADLSTTTPFANFAPAPAVDGVNGKIEGFGGTLAQRSLYGSEGALSIPLGGQYGAQVDGLLGSWGDRTVGSIAPHLFWRNPAQGLIGFYTSHTWWDQFGGIYVGRVAGEGERYSGPITLQGIAGVEYGNSRTNITVTPAGTFVQPIDVKTRFFDEINLRYYLTNNWDVFAGHRYLGGANALALGTQVAIPLTLGRGTLATAFVEGRVGETRAEGVWGGVKIYFGQKDKSLIDRHRQDDPIFYSLGSLGAISAAIGQAQFNPAPKPKVSSCSSSCT